jgi:hypothetical protein
VNLVTATLRDLREFIESKKRKREPLQWVVKAAAQATYHPADRASFASFRQRLRDSRDFARASERLDKLERDLRKRDAVLPLPNEAVQNEDRSITLHYRGLCVRAFPDDIAALYGGTAGHLERGVNRALVEALVIIDREQRLH